MLRPPLGNSLCFTSKTNSNEEFAHNTQPWNFEILEIQQHKGGITTQGYLGLVTWCFWHDWGSTSDPENYTNMLKGQIAYTYAI